MLAQIGGWRKEEVGVVAQAMAAVQCAKSEEGSIRLRSPAAPESGAEEKGRVTPLRMTAVRAPCRVVVASEARCIVPLREG
jgi:hypothetical protein